jgi:hypothetical protein
MMSLVMSMGLERVMVPLQPIVIHPPMAIAALKPASSQTLIMLVELDELVELVRLLVLLGN